MEVFGVFGVSGGGSSADVPAPFVFDVGKFNRGMAGFIFEDDWGGDSQPDEADAGRGQGQGVRREDDDHRRRL